MSWMRRQSSRPRHKPVSNEVFEAMHEIKAPPEFEHFVRTFFPDGIDEAKIGYEPSQDPSREELLKRMIALRLGRLKEQDKRRLKEFLADLLAKNPSEQQLQKLWNSADPHYLFVGNAGHEAMRVFLTMLRDQIA
jgi:hypothetical protein